MVSKWTDRDVSAWMGGQLVDKCMMAGYQTLLIDGYMRGGEKDSSRGRKQKTDGQRQTGDRGLGAHVSTEYTSERTERRVCVTPTVCGWENCLDHTPHLAFETLTPEPPQ